MPAVDFGPKVDKEIERIETSEKLTEKDKETLFEYKRDMEVEGLSSGRIFKLLCHTRKIAERLGDKNLVDANEDDIKDLVAWVERRDLTEWTKTDYRRIIKRFFKWENGGEYPEKVEWVSTTYSGNKEKLPEKLITEDDVERLINAAKNPRNEALIAVMWETGARPGEYLDLKIDDIEDRRNGKKVIVEGKTGARRLPLLSSVPYLSTWLSQHPAANDPEAPLWCRLDNHPHKRISYDYFRRLIREIAERAEVDKPMFPYQFRHSRATYLANRLTEAQMCKFFGWVQGSDRPSTYVHISGRDIDDAYDEIYGFESKDQKEAKLSPSKCPRCGEVNRPDAKYCQNCSLPMDSDVGRRIQEDEELGEKLYSEKVEAEGNIEDLVERMVEKRLKEILGGDLERVRST